MASFAGRKRHIGPVTAPYVPLRNLSCFTMLEGAMEPRTIATSAAALGFPAIALTDRNGLYAAMPFSDACAAKGVQPIIGAMLAIARPPEIGGGERFDWLVLLAKDEAGYANLCKLVSQAHLDRPVSEEPHVAMSALDGASDGLIALTAGSEGALARLIADGQDAKARAYLDRLQALFPDRLYIELSRRGDAIEGAAEAGADRARLRARPAAGRDQPRRLHRSQLPRRARRHAVHRQFGLSRKQRARHLVARSLAQGRRGDGRIVRRPARGDRQHVGDRPALRGRRAQARARSCRGCPTTRTRPCAATPTPASRHGCAGRTPRGPAALSASASISSSTSSPAWASPATS